MYLKCVVCMENSKDLEQMPHSAVSDLGLDTLFAKAYLSQYFRLLTLKTPRKPASENVVCLCHLLNILANFSNLFLHTGKECRPRSDCSQRSSLIWVHTVCKNDFQNHKQMIKQTTTVVIGSLRVMVYVCHCDVSQMR